MKSVEEIAEQLRGSCESLHNVLYMNGMEEMEDNQEFCEKLDAIVFCCEICNWWSEVSDMADLDGCGLVCVECNEEAEG